MPPDSLTVSAETQFWLGFAVDFLNVLVLMATGFVVWYYSRETKRMRVLADAQLALTRQQIAHSERQLTDAADLVRIERERRDDERSSHAELLRQARANADPQWRLQSSPISGSKVGPDGTRLDGEQFTLYNEGAPVSDLELDYEDGESTLSLSPAGVVGSGAWIQVGLYREGGLRPEGENLSITYRTERKEIRRADYVYDRRQLHARDVVTIEPQEF